MALPEWYSQQRCQMIFTKTFPKWVHQWHFHSNFHSTLPRMSFTTVLPKWVSQWHFQINSQKHCQNYCRSSICKWISQWYLPNNCRSCISKKSQKHFQNEFQSGTSKMVVTPAFPKRFSRWHFQINSPKHFFQSEFHSGIANLLSQ